VAGAAEKLLAELERIEQAADKRAAKDRHAVTMSHAAFVTMLFEAIRLTTPEPDVPADRGTAATRRRRPARR
jgi:hypothetical protein